MDRREKGYCLAEIQEKRVGGNPARVWASMPVCAPVWVRMCVHGQSTWLSVYICSTRPHIMLQNIRFRRPWASGSSHKYNETEKKITTVTITKRRKRRSIQMVRTKMIVLMIIILTITIPIKIIAISTMVKKRKYAAHHHTAGTGFKSCPWRWHMLVVPFPFIVLTA